MEFDKSAAGIEAQARNAGIPIIAAYVPDRTQVAMIAIAGNWPAGFDPYKLDNELRTIIESNGETYFDILPDFQTIPNPHLAYFAVDVHPNHQGQALISEFLVRHLTDGTIPALRATAAKQAGLERNE